MYELGYLQIDIKPNSERGPYFRAFKWGIICFLIPFESCLKKQNDWLKNWGFQNLFKLCSLTEGQTDSPISGLVRGGSADPPKILEPVEKKLEIDILS